MRVSRRLLMGVLSILGTQVVCAQAPMLGSIEAPYPNLQNRVTIAGSTYGSGAVAYGPVGTPLVLSGSNLGTSGTVQFIAYKNGEVDLAASPVTATVTMWTSSMLIFNVPAGALSGLVKVTTSGQTSGGLPFLVTGGSYSNSCPAGPTPSQLQITTSSLHDGTLGQPYSATLGASGGTTPYTWSITGGSLPSGLSLNATSGVISGTPNSIATGILTIHVADSSSPQQTNQSQENLTINGSGQAGAVVYSYAANTYHGVGNLTNYTDTVMGNWGFGYDSLNRLISGAPSAGSFSGNNYCWAYDAFGNRTAQVVQSSPCPTLPAVPSATISYDTSNRITWIQDSAPTGLAYDAAGDALTAVTSVGQTYYSYDGEGRICAVQSTPMSGMSSAYGYLYDADGTRVSKGTITPSPNPLTQPLSCDPISNHFQFAEDYVMGPSGEELTQFHIASGTSTWERTNVYTAGKLLATYDLTGLHFHLTDPLGTRRMQLSGNLATLGQPEVDIQSMPFGDQLSSYSDPSAPANAEDSTPLHFTGKEHDTETGNDYFGARYYASRMGRWLSPDSSNDPDPVPFADISDPQSLNLYGYLANNPLFTIDEDGHQAAPDVTCHWACRLWNWLTSPAPDPVDSALNGVDKEIGNTFQSAQNSINRALGGHQQPLQPINGTAEKIGAFGANVGMIFFPGPEELAGLRALSREELLSQITNPSLRNIISKLYREGAAVGDGSTAAAVEHEVATGEQVGGRWHSQKADESINALRKILRNQNLSPRERMIIRYILQRTEKALGKGPI